MQIGDREQALLRPIERAVGIGERGEMPASYDVIPIALVPARAGTQLRLGLAACAATERDETVHLIASFTSSSAASASSASAASP